MPTPRQGYFLASGERVPGTTTVIGRFKDSGALMFWAFAQGKAGKDRLYEEAEKAADIGTLAHAMVEAHLRGSASEDYLASAPTEAVEKADAAFQAYLSWERMTRLSVVEQEMQLISERYRYGGTPDAIGLIDNELCLLDWKTSNSVYVDHLIQLAAYRNLWNENHPARLLTGGSHLLRFAKEHGDFAHHYYPNLDDAWRSFVLMRELYDLDRDLKKRVK
jgi:hypothetical protein